jgi:lipid-binding SYLF domain-containing protein
MDDEMVSQLFSHLFATYGPIAFPVVGLTLIIKYLLDKDKQRETNHKSELEAERERTRSERKRGDDLQMELLAEARGHAVLAEELKNALQVFVQGGRS